VLECSAADNTNIMRIFKTFLRLSKISTAIPAEAAAAPEAAAFPNAVAGVARDDMGLRRNLSAYGRLRSPIMPRAAAPLSRKVRQTF